MLIILIKSGNSQSILCQRSSLVFCNKDISLPKTNVITTFNPHFAKAQHGCHIILAQNLEAQY